MHIYRFVHVRGRATFETTSTPIHLVVLISLYTHDRRNPGNNIAGAGITSETTARKRQSPFRSQSVLVLEHTAVEGAREARSGGAAAAAAAAATLPWP